MVGYTDTSNMSILKILFVVWVGGLGCVVWVRWFSKWPFSKCHRIIFHNPKFISIIFQSLALDIRIAVTDEPLLYSCFHYTYQGFDMTVYMVVTLPHYTLQSLSVTVYYAASV